MLFRFLLCFYLMDIYGIHVVARTEAEIKSWFLNQGLECSKDHPISPDEMQMLRKHLLPESQNAKCLLSCVFKKSGMIDSKGMFDINNSIAMAEKDYADDPKRQESSKKLLELCKKVNDEAVTDSENGCERAVHLLKCIHENAPQVGIQLL